MANFNCAACGASFPSQEALLSHTKMKVSEESIHYRKMSARDQTVPINPTDQEKPQ